MSFSWILYTYFWFAVVATFHKSGPLFVSAVLKCFSFLELVSIQVWQSFQCVRKFKQN